MNLSNYSLKRLKIARKKVLLIRISLLIEIKHVYSLTLNLENQFQI